jgi:hypothetical protein
VDLASEGQQAEQCLQHDGFAGTVRPDDRHVFTFAHVKTEFFYDAAIVEPYFRRLHGKNDVRRQFASIAFSAAVGTCASNISAPFIALKAQ